MDHFTLLGCCLYLLLDGWFAQQRSFIMDLEIKNILKLVTNIHLRLRKVKFSTMVALSTNMKKDNGVKLKKVLFLDIDEVLNSPRSTIALGGVGRLETKDKHLDPIAIGLVRKICKDHDVKIVVSSTWRIGARIEEFSFFDLPIVDMTPVFNFKGRIRGDEIADWLSRHPEVETYAILDDSSDFREEQLPFHVHVPMNNGMTFENWMQLDEIFRTENKDFI